MMLGATSILAWHWQSWISAAFQELFDHPHDSGKHLLIAMAGQELVQDAFAEDVSDVAASIDQQLQCSLDGDKAVMGPVGSGDAHSDQVNLVRMHYPNGNDEVLVSELHTEVDRVGGETGILLLLFS